MADTILNVGDVVTTTLRKRGTILADNLTEQVGLLYWLKKAGNIKLVDSGRELLEPLMHGALPTNEAVLSATSTLDLDNGETPDFNYRGATAFSGNVGFYTGFESFTLDVDTDDIDSAIYQPKQCGGFAFISGRERFMNRGASEVIDLAKARIMVLEANLMNIMGQSLHGDGTRYGGREFGGLQSLVSTSPSSGTIGGIAASNGFWQNIASTGTNLTTANLQSKMNLAAIDVTYGADSANLIVADRTLFAMYWESLQQIQRITTAEKGEAGFRTLGFQGADVLFDTYCPTGTMYFLNTKYLKFKAYRGRFMTPDKRRTIPTADYDVIPVWTMGNFCANSRRAHAVIVDSTVT